MAVASAVISDVERLARGRVLIAALVIYLLCMGFLALGDRLYDGTRLVLYSRLATFPFFILLVLRYRRMVRVPLPDLLLEARQLAAMNKLRAARDMYLKLAGSPPDKVTKRLNRARQLLQDGLCVTVAQEALVEAGRLSIALEETEQAVRELQAASEALPRRAEVAIEYAAVLITLGRADECKAALMAALPHMDPSDLACIAQQPKLSRALEGVPLPTRSSFTRRILFERILIALLVGVAVTHGLHLYLGLF